ncbi:DEAD/DEAH box helicase [Pseudomaricurvus sp.]|uniref:DEAD/DEAH box helicase n=1 Tax=Pseudomaricurvus sp. TaxID=2004510 RepID=UPI003F6A7196
MFADLKINDRLIKALDALEITEPTEVQKATIPLALEGRDLVVSSETGSGKTAAFMLPTLHKLLQEDAPKSGTRALILTPTRELCRQIVKHCKQLAAFSHLEVNAITGGHDFKYQRAIFRKNPEVLVATPGRLKEHIERGSPDFSDLEVLILDEADRMLDMGFTDDVMEIAANCNKDRQTLLFSATLDGQQYLTDSLLRDPETIAIGEHTQANTRVQQKIVLTDDEKHKNKLLLKLLQTQDYDKAIVFINTKAQTNKLVGWLRYMQMDIGVLHGDMDQESRNNEMNRLRRGRVKVLIATDVAARGLDIKGIDLVVNYDLARNSEDFIHRTGRTGRAGQDGLAISLITYKDWDLMARFERELELRFERLAVPGLEAKFKGPKKLKSSGKAAGVKKRETPEKKGKKQEKVKVRHRDTKNIGKRRKPSAKQEAEAKSVAEKWGDGFAPAPLKKK